MIIQVCGHLIDTQYIYEIHKVESNWVEVGDIGYESYRNHGSFRIDFLSNRSIYIEKDSYSRHKTMHTPEYKKEESQISKQLNYVRDQLICKWTANQLSIPKIEFDES